VLLDARGGQSLHRLLGPWFTLLVFGDRAPQALRHPLLQVVAVGPHCDTAGRAALLRQLGVDAVGGEAWLIRPDQHVAARRADAASFDLQQALAPYSDALHPTTA